MIDQFTLEHFQGLKKVPARSTVSEWLSGVALRWDFVEAVIDICSKDAEIALSRRRQARVIWNEAEKVARGRQKTNQRPEGIRPISPEKLLAWLGRAPAAPPAEQQPNRSTQSTARRISEYVSGGNLTVLAEGLLDNLHPRTWEILIKELRAQGKEVHAVQLIQELGSRGNPHKITPIVEFLRTDGHFGDDRILLESIAKKRTAQDLLIVIESFRRGKQILSAHVVTEKIGVVRDTFETVEIILEFKRMKESEILAGILEGAGKWRDAKALAELINRLRARGLGEGADLVLLAAGAERGASSFPSLVQALKDTCQPGDMIKLAHAVGFQRARPRLQPLEDILWKTNHHDVITLVRRLTNYHVFTSP
ncbi:hypothetical protein [Streptomyces sp. A1136]|uniref:hypothetical protein n=1 Tax=Streptomyces sp. A1136 TaxID=2563102 RepID=UPI00109EC81F|nr:hypothetical protein [Streptomyces sp. A1136]THA45045.1 hypothetical protein E6R62_36020 [Streptomyces sp. A1136]